MAGKLSRRQDQRNVMHHFQSLTRTATATHVHSFVTSELSLYIGISAARLNCLDCILYSTVWSGI